MLKGLQKGSAVVYLARTAYFSGYGSCWALHLGKGWIDIRRSGVVLSGGSEETVSVGLV